MDKLGIVGGSLISPSGKRKDKKKVGRKKTEPTGFKAKVREAEESGQNGEVSSLREGLDGLEQAEELLDDVHRLGDALKRDESLAALRQYRSAVKRFYQYVVTSSFEASRVDGRLNPRTMSRKQYTVISIIDEKLEKLGAAVLRSQKEQLNILKKIDEIHGLLIDLTR